MDDEDGTMSKPHFRNEWNWNTALSILSILVIGGGVIASYAILQNQQHTNTSNISSLQEISSRQEGRITTLEVNRAADVARLEEFKKDVLQRVDKLTDTVTNLAQSNAKLAGSIEQERRDTRHRMKDDQQ
jgi:hypothetical protein